jgi:ribosomal protein S12 methylthiotransferase
MPEQLPQSVMDERRDRLMAIQQPISARKNAACIGQVVPVLIEQENPETGEAIGRAARFSPEVDGLVYVRGNATLNSLVPVKIDAADSYDLSGTVTRGELPMF